MTGTVTAALAGQGWLQLGELTLAFLLSAAVGLEREMRRKSAGLRTYALVGVAAALFMLVSKYGFMNILANDRVVLDPSRIAAQVVSGIGFIGGGVIFMHRDAVRGLTTAASVWMTAALGMACGAGLPLLALAALAGHFVIMFAFPPLVRRLPRSPWAPSTLRIAYQDGGGLLRLILVACGQHRFAVDNVQVDREDPDSRIVRLSMEVRGKGSLAALAARLAEIKGVTSVRTGDANEVLE